MPFAAKAILPLPVSDIHALSDCRIRSGMTMRATLTRSQYRDPYQARHSQIEAPVRQQQDQRAALAHTACIYVPADR